ncbi:MAG: hypothetical protein Q8M88_03865 [Phenylobacterium sp.]|uniref:hypothetical protein n=1 Tax=Phenylobacterium sp. TaxID=1871053 RepID=UPI002733C664|nr:hypothetical protein [Phenylobacterium sp.]MDP3173552.1 hypothetical protein [Phenylobacterium sp.]
MGELQALGAVLEGSALGVWARGSTFGYPLVNVVHLLGMVFLLGSACLLDLRIAGAFRALPLAALARILIPAAAVGLLLLVLSGFVMFSADAGPLLGSTTFRWKVALIVLALSNVLAFHLIWGFPNDDQRGMRSSIGRRVMALLSVAMWLGVATLGRLIAYS